MSKKQLHSRIERLFSNLAEENSSAAQPLAASSTEKPAGLPAAALPSPSPAIDPPSPPQQKKRKTGQLLASPHPENATSQPVPADSFQGFAIENGSIHPASLVWTETGSQSMENNEIALNNACENKPAVIAVPMRLRDVGELLLEIVDDGAERTWSEDDRFLVLEVAAQLALALDNAQLYISVQQELAERIRAEKATLRRNKDLAALNQFGQELSRLATHAEIYALLSRMIGEVLDNRNQYICTYIPSPEMIEFPVYRQNGISIEIPSRPFAQGLPEYVIRSRAPLLIASQAAEELQTKGISLSGPVPSSLLAIPIITGERALGAVVVQNFQEENAFDDLHVELLSTAAAQAATALENAALFQQMQTALELIENRERYQSSVAGSAALLTEFGVKALPNVLKLLGQAVQCGRVYFARPEEDESGTYWTAADEWVDPTLIYLFDQAASQHITIDRFPGWAQQLRENGWCITSSNRDQSPEAVFLKSQHIRTSLLLAVPGKSPVPGFLAFDQVGAERSWLSEEINALRVAADAISNTIIRESLLDQIQLSLEETESLYQASNLLTRAGDLQDMLHAILSELHTPEITRAVLLLFEYDQFGKLVTINTAANWHSGRGTSPSAVGTQIPRKVFEHFLQVSTPLFLNDIVDAPIEIEIREILVQLKIRALAVLPLWSGKRQNGVLLLQSETPHHFTSRETRTYPPLVDQMAIAIENKRLFDQTQKALAETGLLYHVSNRIAQAVGPADMLSLVVETMLPAGADHVSLVFVDSNAIGVPESLEYIGTQDARGTFQPLDLRLPVSAFPILHAITDQPLMLADIRQDPLDSTSRETLLQMKYAACCLVPLRTSGRFLGLLIVSSNSPAQFPVEEIRLLRIAANGIAVALEKQRLLRQAQRRALELQAASEIARDSTSTLSLDLLLEGITNLISERFAYYHVAIYLLEETGAAAVIREANGEAGQVLKKQSYKFAVGANSVIGQVTASGVPLILNDTSRDALFSPHSLLHETRSEMCIPLVLNGSVIGALDLQSRQPGAFSQDDVTVLQILADQTAIAIENAQAYELSQKAIADMQELDRVKSQFLANMSHELRTPLNSIIGFSRVIIKGIDGPVNEIQQQDLTAIYNSGQHLLSLINDILDLSKIEAGKMELAYSDINVSDLINSALSTAVGLVKDKPIQLKTVIPDLLPPVRADTTRVRQVLINFLSNAAKFTDAGLITVEAQHTQSPDGRPEIMISVTDTGPGIAAQDQAKLFLPFSQVDDSPTRKTGGTGLGLSICRSLIEMHSGRIGLLRSEPGKGSTFFFSLPAVLPSQEPVDLDIGAETSTVLAIDDDPRVISLYERYLRPHGYTVVPLTDPTQVFQRIAAVKPFAITLDIMMPEKDGWQVLKELKNNPETRAIPIIICSILENQEKGFSMGAADYLVKPFLEEDILGALGRLDKDGEIRDVLIIDDSADDLRLIQKMFEKQQRYRVIAVEGGPEGWQSIQSYHPDAVILDLLMPDLNGFTILENLRTTPALRQIPVILLTGADLSPEQHLQLTEFGQGVLSKGDMRENELLVAVEDALRKFKSNQPHNE